MEPTEMTVMGLGNIKIVVNHPVVGQQALSINPEKKSWDHKHPEDAYTTIANSSAHNGFDKACGKGVKVRRPSVRKLNCAKLPLLEKDRDFEFIEKVSALRCIRTPSNELTEQVCRRILWNGHTAR